MGRVFNRESGKVYKLPFSGVFELVRTILLDPTQEIPIEIS